MQMLLDVLAERVPRDDLAQARFDVGHGEYGMALENLCEAMYEQNLVLTVDSVSAIGQLAAELGLEPHRWEFVEQLAETADVDLGDSE